MLFLSVDAHADLADGLLVFGRERLDVAPQSVEFRLLHHDESALDGLLPGLDLRKGIQSTQEVVRRLFGAEVDPSAGRFTVGFVFFGDDADLFQMFGDVVVVLGIELVAKIGGKRPSGQIKIDIGLADVFFGESHSSSLARNGSGVNRYS